MLKEHGIRLVVSRWLTAIFVVVSLFSLSACNRSVADANALAGEAEALRQANRYDEAKVKIAEAIEIRDDIPEFYLLQGRIQFESGARGDAYLAYRNALPLEPNNQEALLAVSQLGFENGDLRASMDATDQLLLQNPKQPEALLIRGLQAQIRGRYEDSIADADKILSIDPTHEGGIILKARASFLNGDTEGAVKAIETLPGNRPVTWGIALTRLEIYRQVRDANRMAATFADLDRLMPDDPAIMIDQAHFLYKTGKRDEGTRLALRALALEKLQPADILKLIALIEGLSPRPLPQQQVQLVKAGTADARIELGRFLVENGQIAAGLDLVDSLTGNDADAIRALGALLKGDQDGAFKMAQAILKKDSSHCHSLGVLSKVEIARKEARAAINFAQKAAAECPQMREAWLSLASAYDIADDDSNALRAYQQAVDANPQDPVLAYSYTQWLLGKGRNREAISAARRLTRDMSGYVPAWEHYRDLCKQLGNSCEAIAAQGLENARTVYGIDLPPGERKTNGLFGRFLIR